MFVILAIIDDKENNHNNYNPPLSIDIFLLMQKKRFQFIFYQVTFLDYVHGDNFDDDCLYDIYEKKSQLHIDGNGYHLKETFYFFDVGIYCLWETLIYVF